MADYEEEVLIETEPEDSNFIKKNIVILSLVLFKKYFAARRSPTPRRDIKSSIQGVRSRIRSAIVSLTMKVVRISSLEYLWIT